jgi:choline dehydrogenase-like flavoprotein
VIHFFGLTEYDLIVIGSGFGGTMAAAPAVLAGKRVLMIEAGDWVARGPENWRREGFSENTPYYRAGAPLDLEDNGRSRTLGGYLCVGGASVFYGGVAMRMREADFEPDPDIVTDSGAEWPYRYRDLEPYYAQAESLLEVAGESGADPTEPPRSTGFPRTPGRLAPISRRLSDAARALGLHPFRLPLAINYMPATGRQACEACGTCDGYACQIQAKNDLSTVLLPKLQRAGLELVVRLPAVRLEHAGGRLTSVVCAPPGADEEKRFRGRVVVLAAGTLATPRLLLSSRLEAVNPGGRAVGRYLMRHCNAVVMGVFPRRPAPDGEFHKQIGIHDYYFGHPSVTSPSGRLGCLQQFGTPAPWIARDQLPLGLGALISPFVSFTTGFIVMAEDRPRFANGVALPARVTHRYDARDLAARAALIGAARSVLRKAGALFTVTHMIRTFSHGVGTVRLGCDPRTSPLDEWGGFRGIENLYVADGSALPRSAAVNPSLTIAANALRTGTHIMDRL